MKPRDHERSGAGEPVEAEPLFSAELRAELRRELGPSAANRTRVRDALWSSAATGALSPAAQRVDTLLQAKAASAVGAKATAAATVHSLTAKLVIASVLFGGGATAVVLRAPSVHERPAAIAPAAARESRAVVTQPVLPLAPAAESVQAAPPEPASRAALTAASDPPKRSSESARRPPKLSAAGSDSRATRLQLRAASAPSEGAVVAQADISKDPAHAVSPLPSVAAPVPAPLAESDPVSATQLAQPVESAARVSPPTHALAAEIALVRAASEALQRNDPQTALAQLQRHAAGFPRGALRVEVEALRAIALCTTHSDQAAAVSGKFLQAHAGAPLAERVRRACLEL